MYYQSPIYTLATNHSRLNLHREAIFSSPSSHLQFRAVRGEFPSISVFSFPPLRLAHFLGHQWVADRQAVYYYNP